MPSKKKSKKVRNSGNRKTGPDWGWYTVNQRVGEVDPKEQTNFFFEFGCRGPETESGGAKMVALTHGASNGGT